MVPTRHAYGALVLEQGHEEETAPAYAEDIGLEGTTSLAHANIATTCGISLAITTALFTWNRRR